MHGINIYTRSSSIHVPIGYVDYTVQQRESCWLRFSWIIRSHPCSSHDKNITFSMRFLFLLLFRHFFLFLSSLFLSFSVDYSTSIYINIIVYIIQNTESIIAFLVLFYYNILISYYVSHRPNNGANEDYII